MKIKGVVVLESVTEHCSGSSSLVLIIFLSGSSILKVILRDSALAGKIIAKLSKKQAVDNFRRVEILELSFVIFPGDYIIRFKVIIRDADAGRLVIQIVEPIDSCLVIIFHSVYFFYKMSEPGIFF